MSEVRRYILWGNVYEAGPESTDTYVLASDHDAAIATLRAMVEQIEAQLSDDAFGGALWDEVQKDKLAKMTAERDAALAQVQSLERDARRYRWLKSGGTGTGLYVADAGNDWHEVLGEKLDERIDSALAASATQPMPASGEGE